MLLGNTAWAGVAGHAQFVNGHVQIMDAGGAMRLLQKGGSINEGDTLLAGKASTAQIRMADGGIIAVRPDSRLKFDEFKFSGQEDGSEKSFFSLFKGGFRAVTGMIGRVNKQNYRITTPAATIGIRGTDHETAVVTPNGNSVSPGTYNMVNVGETAMTTDVGTISVKPGQGMAYSPGMDQQPVLMPLNINLFSAAPPQGEGGEQGEGGGQGKNDKESEAPAVREASLVDNAGEVGGSNPEPVVAGNTGVVAPIPLILTDANNNTLNLTTGLGLIGTGVIGGNGVKFTVTTGLDGIETGVAPHLPGVSPTQLEVLQMGPNVTGTFNAVGLTRWNVGAGFIGAGTAQQLDIGWDAGTVHWGRWGGSGLTAAGGWANSLAFGPNQGWHFLIGIPTVTLPVTGTFNYNLVGGTSPTPSDGIGAGLGLGQLVSGSATVNFQTMSLSGKLGMQFSGASLYQTTYSATGITPNFIATGTTTFQSGATNVCAAGCATQIQGSFFGANASHLGIGYLITADQFFKINGVAVMK